MPEFSMCSGEGCGVRGGCERYTAKPGEWQVWFARPPRDEKSCLWIIVNDRWEVSDVSNRDSVA